MTYDSSRGISSEELRPELDTPVFDLIHEMPAAIAEAMVGVAEAARRYKNAREELDTLELGVRVEISRLRDYDRD